MLLFEKGNALGGQKNEQLSEARHERSAADLYGSRQVNAAKKWLDIKTAAHIAYANLPGWRVPPTDEIEIQRAAEAREDQRRDDDYVERED